MEMKFLIDVAVEEIEAAVESEGLAYEEDDAPPYTRARSTSITSSVIEFSLDTNLVEASGILLVTYDSTLSLADVYVADFDPGSFRVVCGGRRDLTPRAFVLGLADSLARSPRVANVDPGSEWEEKLSFKLVH